MSQRFRFDTTIIRARSIATFIFLLPLGIGILSCSGGGSPASTPTPPAVSITISPTAGSVQTGATLQLVATVSGTTNSAVIWQVNGTAGGSTSNGTISLSGLYTAPSAVPTPDTVTIAAISSADSTKSATAAISIAAPRISVSVTPSTASVVTLQNQQFTAAVSNTSNTAVVWSVNGMTGGSSQVGTISTSGLYTAPSAIPSPGTVTITATSAADSTKSAAATVTITAPPVSVSATPSTASVITLHNQQFTATVSNTTNTAVIWSVNGTVGGSSPTGTISVAGLYTAPSAVPSPGVVTITATSVADVSKSASAQVTIQPPPVPTGTWTFLGPAGASNLLQLVADPGSTQTLYAAPSFGGLYKTTDLGANWSQFLAATGVPVSLVIAPASGTLYILSEDHFQTSTDGGKTISSGTKYPGNLDSEPTAFTFAVDPKNDQTIYILSSTSLVRSRDGGTTWTALTAPPSPYLVNGVQAPALGTFLVSSSNSSVLMSASSNGFAISKDGGSTWQLQNSGLDTNFSSLHQIIQDPMNPNRVLCLGIYPGISPYSSIYVSLDGGVSWTHQGTAYVYDQLVMGQTGPSIYILSKGSLYATPDGGATYKNIGPPADQVGFTAVFSPLSANVIAYEGLNDISVSQDRGGTWTVSQTGMNARAMGQVVYAGTTGPLFAATLFSTYLGNNLNSAQLWKAPDATSAWSRPVDEYSDLPILQFDVDLDNPLRILGVEQANTTGTPESSVLSSDGGLTWSAIPYAAGMQDQFGYQKFSVVHFGAPNSNSAFACGTFGVARLSTVTDTWTIINNGISSGAGCTALGVDRATSGTVYATTTAGVYKSIDGGNNWSFLFQAPGTYATVLVDPKNSNNVFLSGGSSMRSTDGGKTWTLMNVGGMMAMNPVNPNLMYAITPNSLSASLDAGLTWASIVPPAKFLEDIAVTASGTVVITTAANGVVAFTPN